MLGGWLGLKTECVQRELKRLEESLTKYLIQMYTTLKTCLIQQHDVSRVDCSRPLLLFGEIWT